MKRYALMTFLLFGGSTAAAQPPELCWIDSATGQPVPTVTFPSHMSVSDYLNYVSGDDRLQSHSSTTGQNFFRQPSGDWIDSATGQPVPTVTIPSHMSVSDYGNYVSGDDRLQSHSTTTGQNFVRVACPPPDTSATQAQPVGQGAPLREPPAPPPPPTPTFSGLHSGATGPYVGIGGSYFFEPGTQIALAGGLAGYRLTPHVGVELQVDLGVTRERFDNGSTFRSSTGISWSAMPYVVGYLPVGPGAELFARGGYGAYRFHQTSTFFSGPTRTDFSSSSTVGAGALGGGVQIGLGGSGAIRADYQHLFFHNGSHADEVGITFVLSLGRR
jgi:hypothetical protein